VGMGSSLLYLCNGRCVLLGEVAVKSGMTDSDDSIERGKAERQDLKVAGWEPKGRGEPRPSGKTPLTAAGTPITRP
jgi:hypothetical protein